MNYPVFERPNPYIGPRSFTSLDTDRFFGRELEREELIDQILADRIVLLYSASGAGKTSLIQAALIPELQQEGFLVYPVVQVNLPLPAQLENNSSTNRYLVSALISLEEMIGVEFRLGPDQLAQMTLDDYLSLREKDTGAERSNGVILVFDQFEDIFTTSHFDRRAVWDFLDLLGKALLDRRRGALFALREDYLAQLDEYRSLIPNRWRSTYRLTLLTPDQALEAIRRPVESIGIAFDEDAAHRLVDDMRRVSVEKNGMFFEEMGLYVEPVQLQVVCRNIWSNLAENSDRITLEDLTAPGSLEESLRQYYDELVARVCAQTSALERSLRAWIQEFLISPEGWRSQVILGPDGTAEVNRQAIDLLVDANLVHKEPRNGVTWLEITHDRLVGPILASNQDWFTTHQPLLMRQARVWNEQHRPDGLLLSGAVLKEARKWATENPSNLTAFEMDFLKQSIDLDRDQLFRRYLLPGAVILLILSNILTFTLTYLLLNRP